VQSGLALAVLAVDVALHIRNEPFSDLQVTILGRQVDRSVAVLFVWGVLVQMEYDWQ